jgi:hypothetical protein
MWKSLRFDRYYSLLIYLPERRFHRYFIELYYLSKRFFPWFCRSHGYTLTTHLTTASDGKFANDTANRLSRSAPTRLLRQGTGSLEMVTQQEARCRRFGTAPSVAKPLLHDIPIVVRVGGRFPVVPQLIAAETGGDDVPLRILATILSCFKMLGCTLEQPRLGWCDAVGCGKRLWVADPHRQATVEAAARLGKVGGMTETGQVIAHSGSF